jgi:hypothetical protein
MGAIADRKDTTNYLIFQNLSTGFFTGPVTPGTPSMQNVIHSAANN